MNKTMPAILLVIPVTLALLLATACGRKAGPPKTSAPATVNTSPALRMDVPVVLHTFGTTGDRANVNIVPQVSGILVKALIPDGAVVTNGQPLFQIDTSDYQARLHQAEGVLAADKASLELDRLTLQRNAPLLEKKLIPAETFDSLAAKVAVGEARLRTDEASLEQARLNLLRCTIISPINGICSRRLVDEGNLVAAGQTVLINIRSYDPLDVDFSVPEQYLPALRQSMKSGIVRIRIKPRGDTNLFSGELTFIDNAVSTATGTILLRGQVPNPEHALWAQQFVDITLILDTRPNTLMVPEGAVMLGKNGAYLFVMTKDNKADRRAIKTGIRHNNLMEITEGVTEGEKVVVLGQMTLFPGAPIQDAANMTAPASTPPAGSAPQEPGKAAR